MTLPNLRWQVCRGCGRNFGFHGMSGAWVHVLEEGQAVGRSLGTGDLSCSSKLPLEPLCRGGEIAVINEQEGKS